MSVDFDVRGQQGWTFHWRKSYNGLWTEAKVYSENGFVSYKLYKTLIDGLYYYFNSIVGLFLSATWALILTAPIHCRGSGSLVNKRCSTKFLKNVHMYWPYQQRKTLWIYFRKASYRITLIWTKDRHASTYAAGRINILTRLLYK